MVLLMESGAPWYRDVVIPALLRHARTAYGQAMRRALGEAGYDDIPANGLYIIGGLAMGDKGLPIGQLCRDLNVSKQAAGQLVDTLVLRGYLDRRTDEQDRRKLIVTLTERGRAAAAVQATARDAVDAELLAAVGPEDIERTKRSLAVLCQIGKRLREAID
jgi:DNA-binding MarR family transcriptional regulator